MERYWVIGGLFTNTDFTEIAPGHKRHRLGPFDDYAEAKAVWRAKSMEHVDEAYARFGIEREASDEYWVIGGIYTDTNFKEIAPGEEEQRHGPYTDYQTAKEKWWACSSAHIDNAYARFRIDKV